MARPTPPAEPLYEMREVASIVGVSQRWLADQCRAGRIEHVHIARHRRFTAEQLAVLLATHTVRPARSARPARERPAALPRGQARESVRAGEREQR